MRGHADFSMRTWLDPWFRSLPLESKLFFLYSFTNEHANHIGVYVLPLDIAANEIGTTVSAVETALEDCKDKIMYDPEECVIFVVNKFKHQFLKAGQMKGNSHSNAIHVYNSLKEIKHGHPFVAEFMELYGGPLRDVQDKATGEHRFTDESIAALLGTQAPPKSKKKARGDNKYYYKGSKMSLTYAELTKIKTEWPEIDNKVITKHCEAANSYAMKTGETIRSGIAMLRKRLRADMPVPGSDDEGPVFVG